MKRIFVCLCIFGLLTLQTKAEEVDYFQQEEVEEGYIEEYSVNGTECDTNVLENDYLVEDEQGANDLSNNIIVESNEELDMQNYLISDEIDYEINAYSSTAELQATSSYKDDYENNDTFENAYNYSWTKPVSTVLRSRGQLYSLGMRTGGLYSSEDEDWFKADYRSGETVFVDLRNIGHKNINIALFDQEKNILWDSNNDLKFEGRPEKYFDFHVRKTGTYYIKIYTLGDLPEPNYYFYFGLKNNQKFEYRVQMQGSQISQDKTFSTRETDFTAIFPKSAKAASMFLSPKIGNIQLTEMTIRINRIPYTTKDMDGRLMGISGANLYGNCTVEGRLPVGNTGIAYYAPVCSGFFTCSMEPYPGNEL